MNVHHVLGAFAVVLCGSLVAGQSIQSGPKAGTNIPDAMLTVVVHAERPDSAGKRQSFVEEYGANPYVLIFARTAGEPLTGLITKVNAEMARHRDAKGEKANGAGAVRGVVILLSEQEGLEKQLRKLAKQLEINHLSFAIDKVAGPRSYRLAKEADLTVLLVNRRKVEANYAFRKDELRDMHVTQIVADLQKMVQAERE